VPGPAPQAYAVPTNSRFGPDQPGVREEQKTLAGSDYTRTATKIVLAKRASIPTPRPNRLAQDPAGDNPTNYSASGLDANRNIVHSVKSDLLPGSIPGQRMMMLPDLIAYAFNWEGLHPFVYHANDWSVAQEGAAGSTLTNQIPPNYSTLDVDDYLAAPTPKYLDIDHRYGFTPIYENESAFSMLEDGSIVLYDGWGSELRMGGGNIEWHCAGDFRIFAGRNVITWAGNDFTVKAVDSIDLVAENADLRTQAGRNSHHLSGNTGCGGFLFETKAVCPSYSFHPNTGEDVTSSGFVVLSPYSQIWLRGQDVAIELEPTADDGRIVINAGMDNEIETMSSKLVNRVAEDGSIVHLFKGEGANEFTATYNLLGADTFICGKAAPTGGLGKPGTPSPCDRVTSLTDDYDPEFDSTKITPPGSYYAEFSHRTAVQYLSTNFVYWRSRWQGIATEDAQDLPTWPEPIVVGLRTGLVSRPHPGERWTEVGSYMSPVYSLVDPLTGWTAIDRDVNAAIYELPILEDPVADSLSNKFVIPFFEE
jgi:hypothetical protein